MKVKAPPDAADLRYSLQLGGTTGHQYQIWDKLLDEAVLFTENPSAANKAVQALNYYDNAIGEATGGG